MVGASRWILRATAELSEAVGLCRGLVCKPWGCGVPAGKCLPQISCFPVNGMISNLPRPAPGKGLKPHDMYTSRGQCPVTCIQGGGHWGYTCSGGNPLPPTTLIFKNVCYPQHLKAVWSCKSRLDPPRGRGGCMQPPQGVGGVACKPLTPNICFPGGCPFARGSLTPRGHTTRLQPQPPKFFSSHRSRGLRRGQLSTGKEPELGPGAVEACK